MSGLAKISQVEEAIEFVEACKSDKELLKALPILYKKIEAEFPNQLSLKVKLSKVRKIIKNKFPNSYKQSTMAGTFNLPYEDLKDIKANYEQRVESQNKDIKVSHLPHLEDHVKRLLKDTDPFKRALALLIVSGSRPIELFGNTTTFKVENDKINNISIEGIAKKRTEGFTVTRPILFIPVKTFLSGVKKLRREAKYDSSDTALYNAAIAEFGVTPKMFRKWYVDLAYEKYGQGQNFNTFIKNVLGHDSLLTSFSYSHQKVNISPETAEPAEPGEPPKEYTVLKRQAPKADKLALLELIYKDSPGATSRKLKAISHLGSDLINEFLKAKNNPLVNENERMAIMERVTARRIEGLKGVQKMKYEKTL